MSTPSPERSLPPSATESERRRDPPEGGSHATAPPALDTRDQARTIARATFDGFLQSDLVPQGMQAPALIWAAAFLVGPALFLPTRFLVKYPFIRRFHPERLESAFWDDRMLFLILSAGAMGVVSVVLWDTLFPARRDAFVLTPLPVSLPVQMLGRLLGLSTLCIVFAVALNVIPAVTFPVTSAAGFLEMPRSMAAHLVATTAADVFVFFGITAIQGVVILALGRGAAARLAAVAQTATVVVLLLALLFFGALRDLTKDAIVRGDSAQPELLFLPTAWFLGLYEYIAGSPRPVMGALALRAIVAAVVPLAVTAAIYAFGYHRLLARAVETPHRSRRPPFVTLGSRLVRALFVRQPQQQAICGFVLRAVSRSGRHSMLASIYVGAALALMITFVLPDLLRFGPSAFAEPAVPVLALPLVLSVGLAVGVRILMTIPAEMGARWIFMTSALTPRRTDAAAHKALLLLVVPAVVVTAAATAGPLWGARIAVVHAAFCASLSVLLCEVLLMGYRGVPLTRPYVPGASRFHMLWGLYLTIFLTYTYTSARLERDLLKWTGGSGVLEAAAVFCTLALGIWIVRKYRLRHTEEVPFEADMPEEQMFQGFNLTEIYTAQAVASRAPTNAPRDRPV
jgi:hypothetical protein